MDGYKGSAMKVSRETLPRPGEPLPVGWHRVVWTDRGTIHYMVTTEIVAAVFAKTALQGQAGNTDIEVQSWSDYPIEERR